MGSYHHMGQGYTNGPNQNFTCFIYIAPGYQTYEVIASAADATAAQLAYLRGS